MNTCRMHAKCVALVALLSLAPLDVSRLKAQVNVVLIHDINRRVGSRRVDLPLERVIDDVASMGFSRREVKEVVLEMMHSGQAVDLNVVVDRLMNRN